MALQQLIDLHRRHIVAKGRSLRREEQYAAPLPDHSAIELAMRLMANHTSPSDAAARRELRAKVQAVLAELSEGDREVLVLRFLEQTSTKETAAILGLTVNGVILNQVDLNLNRILSDPILRSLTSDSQTPTRRGRKMMSRDRINPTALDTLTPKSPN